MVRCPGDAAAWGGTACLKRNGVLRHRGSSILRETSLDGDPSLNGVRRHGNRVSNQGSRPGPRKGPHNRVSNQGSHRGPQNRGSRRGRHHGATNRGPQNRVSNGGSKAHSPDNRGVGNPGPQNRGSSPGRDNQDHMAPRLVPTGGRCTLRHRSRVWHPYGP